MPRPRSKNPPVYSHHKASGRAVTRLNGRDRYLGSYGSPESHAEYERLVSEWRAEQLDLQQATHQAVNTPGGLAAHKNLTVADVLLLSPKSTTPTTDNRFKSPPGQDAKCLTPYSPMRNMWFVYRFVKHLLQCDPVYDRNVLLQ